MAEARKVESLPEAVIRGETIKVGQPADAVRKRLEPDYEVDPNRNKTYGYTSTARYVEGDSIYIVKFGPPKSGWGAYVVTEISRAKAQSG